MTALAGSRKAPQKMPRVIPFVCAKIYPEEDKVMLVYGGSPLVGYSAVWAWEFLRRS